MIPILGDFYVWPWHGFRIIAVTDDAMNLLSATHWWRWKPKEFMRKLPRDFLFTPHIGRTFTHLDLAADTVWVPLTFKSDMRDAHADLRSGSARAGAPPLAFSRSRT